MEMFDQKLIEKRIGTTVIRSSNLDQLKPVEAYLEDSMSSNDVKIAYDVMASEPPYFKGLSYTEWARSFLIAPMNEELKLNQMIDAFYDDTPITYDYVGYLKSAIEEDNASKYSSMEDDTVSELRPNLVILPGSNRLKGSTCLNKLKFIKDTCGENLWIKPHPLTRYALVGELQDMFGKNCVLDRNTNVYRFLKGAETVYTTHLSETAAYAVALDKKIEPVDVYNMIPRASFFHINKFLFHVDSPKDWINKVMNSPKSGIITPDLDPNWKEKVDKYLEYILNVREKYKNKYIHIPKKKKETSNTSKEVQSLIDDQSLDNTIVDE